MGHRSQHRRRLEVYSLMTRRSLAAHFLAAALISISSSSFAQDTAQQAAAGAVKRHAVSLMGEPKLPPDFKHFEWVNPDAPKGGALRLSTVGGFDSLNPFTVKGQPAAGLGGMFDTLLFNSPDEPSSEYGLIAEWISYPDDYSSVTFGLRPEAKFHDGKPITPEDVVFSLNEMKKSDPRIGFYYQNVVKAEKTGDREVTFTFDKAGNRELPLIVGQLSIVPKHYYEGTNDKGEKRDLAKSTLEPPLGSGAYKIKSVDPGRRIVYERVKDYWAQDLPVAKGQNNFDEISYIYFKDRTPAFEAFKGGDVDFWTETSAGAWATQYEFPALKGGQVKKEALSHKRVASMQAFAFNTRRKPFDDIRVRRAITLSFNFESLNKSIFYGQYVRAQSFFGNSELAATGLPEGRELEFLNAVKADLPPEVFSTPWKSPEHSGDDDFRTNMRGASKLLDEAGWKVSGGQRKNAAGEVLKAEILLVQPDFERIVLPFIENMKKLGIAASVRIVDSSQYEQREKTRDFDIIVDSFGQSHSPGNEQRDYWGSASADREGSRNTIGIKSAAIDKLVDNVVFAKDRSDLVAATRALDRALLWSFYVVPQWYYPYDRIATWDIYGRPATLPSQNPVYPNSWWIDSAKLEAVRSARGK